MSPAKIKEIQDGIVLSAKNIVASIKQMQADMQRLPPGNRDDLDKQLHEILDQLN